MMIIVMVMVVVVIVVMRVDDEPSLYASYDICDQVRKRRRRKRRRRRKEKTQLNMCTPSNTSTCM